METIKIRVWNGFKFGYIHFMPGGTIAMPNQDYMSWYIGNDLVAFSDECAFSSYININDIEKNEIYFGDILESCKGARFLVDKKPHSRGYHFIALSNNYPILASSVYVQEMRLKKIGDKYQNSELLKGYAYAYS